MVYFLSDMHLGAWYIERPREQEQRLVRFLQSIEADATELYLLGDVLDYWYEYRHVVPRGFVRFFGALARLADRGVQITWYIGNHDIWLFDYLRTEIGLRVVDGWETRTILGTRFFLSHGDGLGHLSRGFRFIRSLFRNRLCQRLYAAVHPRWTVPFAHRWSNSSRDFQRQPLPTFRGIDKEPLAQFALGYLQGVDPGVRYFVFGHRHVLVDCPLTPTANLVILGDWIRLFSYARFDGHELTLHTFES